MPDKETDDNLNVQDNEDVNLDVKDDVSPEDDVVDDSKETKDEPEKKETVFEKIGNIIKGKKDDDIPDSSDSDVDTGEIEEGDVIPDEFTDAALAAGWTQQEVMEFTSDYSDEELINLIPFISKAKKEDSDESGQPSNNSKLDNTDKKAEDDNSSKDLSEDERISQLVAKAVEERLKPVTQRQEQERVVAMASRANQVMDDLSKEFDVFGKYDELPKFPNGELVPTSPGIVARNEVWGLAVTLNQSGVDFEEALSISIDAFKGKNLVKDVKRNLVKDLKKNEKKLSAKRSSRESTNTDGMSGPDIIRAVGKKHGVEIR